MDSLTLYYMAKDLESELGGLDPDRGVTAEQKRWIIIHIEALLEGAKEL